MYTLQICISISPHPFNTQLQNKCIAHYVKNFDSDHTAAFT